MNDQELVNLLLDNYHRQLQCFKQILNDSECELKIISTVEKSDDINKKAEVIKGHVELLKKRGSLLDQIKEIDVEIKGNKIGWDRRKNDVDFEEDQQLKTIVKDIKDMITKMLEYDKKFQEFNNKTLSDLKERISSE